jgi:hypothetical protein
MTILQEYLISNSKQTDEAKLDKMLEACMNTPPITLKQIKEELKKEREEKKRSSENKQ